MFSLRKNISSFWKIFQQAIKCGEANILERIAGAAATMVGPTRTPTFINFFVEWKLVKI